MKKQKLFHFSTFLAVQASVLLGSLLSAPARAACDGNGGISGGASCAQGGGSSKELLPSIQVITNTLLLAVGAGAVIMIIVGAARYVFSGGNDKNTKAAKDTIMYSVVGLVIAVLAYAIVNFVLTQFK